MSTNLSKLPVHQLTVTSWSKFVAIISNHDSHWTYRGQRSDWRLKTSLERGLSDWKIPLVEGPAVESQIVREFRRKYRGADQARLNSDTLYCLALMQHHGAPTRLLDWTYSPFVAAKFAIESGGKGSVIWCLNGRWCHEAASSIVGEVTVRARNVDTSRNDSTFVELYCPTKTPKQRFVFLENPMELNERLVVQQGVFLCHGDIGASFEENLRAMAGWKNERHVVKLKLKLGSENLHQFARMLRKMNVGSAALFPGLDGVAKSLGESLFLFQSFARSRTGESDYGAKLGQQLRGG